MRKRVINKIRSLLGAMHKEGKPVERYANPVIAISRESIQFNVADVQRARGPLPEKPSKLTLEHLIDGKVEQCSATGQSVDAYFHPLMEAAHHAYDDHRPLVLSPDMIWLAIAQGIARHINLNPEKYRQNFVSHEGKKEIHIRRDDFRRERDNPWPETFSQFSSAIREYLKGDSYSMIVKEFSTTGPAERAAMEVTVMDAMQSYFDLTLHTMCGIPSVTLEGTVRDWETLAESVNGIRGLDLEWWTESLKPILLRFAQARFRGIESELDSEWWNNLYKVKGGSGGPYCNGWLTYFCPYITNTEYKKIGDKPVDGFNKDLRTNYQKVKTSVRNPNLSAERRFGGGITTDQFPGGLSRCPFTWDYFGENFNYEFLGGFTGITQDKKTLALRPTIGWAVREVTKEAK